MKPFKQAIIHIIITLTVALSEKNSDEGRSYEFGFTIDGEQHRYEKKDQNGIIQGEFGFITADGVYHVTVYATDENGKFKILSTRNIRIRAPLDGSPATGPISPEAGKYLGKQKEIGSTSTALNKSPVTRPVLSEAVKSVEKQKEIGITSSVSSVQLKNSQESLQAKTQSSGLQINQQSFETPQALPSATQHSKLYEFTTQPTIKPACGGCGYVTTPKSVNGVPFQFQNPKFQHTVNGINGPSSSSENVQSSLKSIFSSTQSTVGNQYLQKVGANEPEHLKKTYVNTQGEFNNGQSDISLIGKQDNVKSQQLAPILSSSDYPNQVLGHNINNGNTASNLIQESFGRNSLQPHRNNQAQVPGINYRQPVNTVNSKQYNNFNNEQNSRRQDSSISNESYQTAKVPYEQHAALFGNFNKGTNEHILSPAPSSIKFPPQIPNPLSHETKQVSDFPPVSVSHKTIRVDGKNPINIPIRDKYPGMIDGLPAGIEENDVKDILYKFHYTVGFHGHYEKGFKNGAKIGGYFVNGRDGISRVVTYVADENGYQPKFKFIHLGLDSDDIPKVGSEKKFGLKSFEFVWYPVE